MSTNSHETGWKEPYTGARYGDRPPDTLPARAGSLARQELICVSVCSFTFKFYRADEIRRAARFQSPKGLTVFFRWHSQRRYERLPMYLQEEGKRVKVLKALRKALILVEAGKL